MLKLPTIYKQGSKKESHLSLCHLAVGDPPPPHTHTFPILSSQFNTKFSYQSVTFPHKVHYFIKDDTKALLILNQNSFTLTRNSGL